jgi:hypothetical protein
MLPTRNISARGSTSVHIVSNSQPIYRELPRGKYWALPLKSLIHRDTTVITRPAGPVCCIVEAFREMARFLCPKRKSLTGVIGPAAAAGSNSPRSRRDAVLRFRESSTSLEPVLIGNRLKSQPSHSMAD